MSTTPLELDSESNQGLKLLRAFRDQVWGDPCVFEQNLTARPHVTYLDFGDHLPAVQLFCEPLERTDKLLVFQEYRIAVDLFDSDHGHSSYPYGACITGHPGIGKSMFIAYAVVHRLRKKQPVAVQLSLNDYSNAYVLFNESGVHPYRPSNEFPLLEEGNVWALSDSTDTVFIPPDAFKRRGVRIFQTASPDKRRWNQWTKECEIDLYVMELPSIEEIGDLALVLGYDPVGMEELAVKYGAVVRTLLWMRRASDHEISHQRRTKRAAANAAKDISAALTAIDDGDLPYSPGASFVFFALPDRAEGRIYRGVISACFPTRWIAAILGDASRKYDVMQQINFFNILAAHPTAHSTAGWLFEKFVHQFLSLGEQHVTIDWSDGCSEMLVTPKSTRRNTTDLKSLPPFYWHPDSITFPGVDGVLIYPKRVLLLQMTVSSQHKDPQDGVNAVWDRIKGARKFEWRFVFIGHDAVKAKMVSDVYADTLMHGPPSKQYALPVGRVILSPGAQLSNTFRYMDSLNSDGSEINNKVEVVSGDEEYASDMDTAE